MIDLTELKRLNAVRTSGKWTYYAKEDRNFFFIDSTEKTGCDSEDEPYYRVCSLPSDEGGMSANWGTK